MDNQTITRALKGDPDAAAECTAAGVAINCPMCGSRSVEVTGIIDTVYCRNCDTQSPILAAWNRRVRMED